MSENDSTAPVFPSPVELLQKLVRFDTTNPPGSEAECIDFINQILTRAGIDTKILAKSPDRPNLVARLPGRGEAPSLLLYGHADVVTTENQQWKHPPFEGRLAEDCIWGRGTLDMKGGIAMMVSAMLRARAGDVMPPGDVVLAVVSDEEAGGDFGARFLVAEHPEEFSEIRYALGEFGGFTFHVGGHRFYPIMVAEKQLCALKVTVRGPGGHGSIPVQGGAMGNLARLLHRLEGQRLPVHVTPAARLMFDGLASALGGLRGLIMAQLSNPRLSDVMLRLLGDRGRLFSPLLRHTVCPTMLRASEQINVIPSEVAVGLDGRLLPGFGPDDLIGELRFVVGNGAEIEVLRHDPGPAEPDMGLFDTLAGVLTETDPVGIPVPFLLAAVTDARFFSRLGIQTYGFLPMQLPMDFSFTETIHAANERIPVETLEFGAAAICRVLKRFDTEARA